MSWLRDFFKPRQDNFVRLLIEQAEFAVKGLEALLAYTRNGDEASADAVRRMEKEADEVRRILVDELKGVLVIPKDAVIEKGEKFLMRDLLGRRSDGEDQDQGNAPKSR